MLALGEFIADVLARCRRPGPPRGSVGRGGVRGRVVDELVGVAADGYRLAGARLSSPCQGDRQDACQMRATKPRWAAAERATPPIASTSLGRAAVVPPVDK